MILLLIIYNAFESFNYVNVNDFLFLVWIAVDHLVNNAGMASVSLFEEIEEITNLRSIMVITLPPPELLGNCHIFFFLRVKLHKL